MDQQQLRKTIAAAKAGQAEGYAALLEAYGSRLYGYFLRATGSSHDAEDLLGEMMLKLVRRLKSYDERGRFDQWLFRIAANMVRDRIRRLKVAPTVFSISAEDRIGRTLGEKLPGQSPPAEARIMAAEAHDRLQRALGMLDDVTRQMVLVRYMGQVSFKELADMFQCPLGTALARVHRGLRTLREYMGRDDGTE